MQSALRSAARRAAGVSSRRGASTATTTTTTEAEREWVASLVRLEVRAQMRVAEERVALERARKAEWSAHLRASELEQEALWKELRAWRNGFFTAWIVGIAGGAYGTLIAACPKR